MVDEPTTRSPSSSMARLRVLEPACTTRMRMRGSPGPSVRPGPGPYLRQILAILPGPRPVLGSLVLHELPDSSRPRPETRHPVDDVDHQMEPVHVVHHDHVEGSGGGPLLLVAAYVQIPVVGTPVGEPVDQQGVAVIGEDHRPI